MSGRDLLAIGTYGHINTRRTTSGTVRAEARYRDGHGTVRKVTATAATVREAKQSLRIRCIADAGLSDLKVTPHTFRRTAGTTIARATDAETAAEVLGNSPKIAKKD